MDIWEKLKENPEDFRLSRVDDFQDRMGQIRWKNSPDAARGLARFAVNGDGRELVRLFNECRREQEDGFAGIGRHRPLNVYVLAKLVHLEDGEAFLWLGSEYLREESPLQDVRGERAAACFQEAVRAGQWEQVMEIGFSLIQEGRFSQGVRILELVQRECKELAPEPAKRICRTLGVLYLNGKVQPPDPYKGERWLKYSVEHYEDENAAYTLGMIYREGKALHIDRAESLKYLTYAAERGHSEAGLFMVRGFLDGDPVFGKLDVDIDNVIPYLSSAAGNLNPEAIYYAGILNCLCGDFDTAAEYMENVKLEKDEAYGILGQIYFLQGKYAEAWPNLRTACEEKGLRLTIEPLFLRKLGDIDENFVFPGLSECMGRYYQQGLAGCCPIDSEKAAFYYEEAVRLGFAGSWAYYFLAERLLARDWSLSEPDKKREILEGKRQALLYWEEAIRRSETNSFPPPQGIGWALFQLEDNQGDVELSRLVARCVRRLEEYAYRTSQCYNKQREDGQIFYEYAYYIFCQAKAQKNVQTRIKIGNEISEYLDRAIETGIVEAYYPRVRICLWMDQVDRAYALCKQGADKGSIPAQNTLKYFKKKVFGGYVYKLG